MITSHRILFAFISLLALLSCKPKTQGLDKAVEDDSLAKQKKYTYSKSVVPIEDSKTAVVYFGLIPDTPPQPGTYRHIKYVPLDNEERSVFVDTQSELFSDWSEFSKIHVVLPEELWAEGKKLSGKEGLELAKEENHYPVVITGLSIVAGVGVAGILLSRVKANPYTPSKVFDAGNIPQVKPKAPINSVPVYKSKAPVGVPPTSKVSEDATSIKEPKSVSSTREEPSTALVVAPSRALTKKTPPRTPGKSWRQWMDENRGKCIFISIIVGCHYLANVNSYWGTSTYYRKSLENPPNQVSLMLSQTQDITVFSRYLEFLGFRFPNLPIESQFEQVSALVRSPSAYSPRGFNRLIEVAGRYLPAPPETALQRLTRNGEFDIDSALTYFRYQPNIRSLTGTYEQQFKAIQSQVKSWPAPYKEIADLAYLSLGNRRNLQVPQPLDGRLPIELTSSKNPQDTMLAYFGTDNIDSSVLARGDLSGLDPKNFRTVEKGNNLREVFLTSSGKQLVEVRVNHSLNQKLAKNEAKLDPLESQLGFLTDKYYRKKDEFKNTAKERNRIVEELGDDSGEVYQELTTRLNNLEKEIADIDEQLFSKNLERNAIKSNIRSLRQEKKSLNSKL